MSRNHFKDKGVPELSSEADSPEKRRKSADSIATGAITSWASQLCTIASGFILPRLIHERLSQEALGLWDLAWSVVVQFKLIQAGFGSSVNRYVASSLARNDLAGVNRLVSSASVVSTAMAFVALVLASIYFFLPEGLLSSQLGSLAGDVRWLILVLGITAAVQIEASALNGIVTGCQRWMIHNGINAVSALLTFAVSIAALHWGFGLVALALIYCAGEVANRVAHWIAAYKVCPGLSVKWRYSSISTMKEMLIFGLKTFLLVGGTMLRHSFIGVMVAMYLGPAALAIFTRPRALVSQVNVFLQKYAFVFVPKTSALQAEGRHQEIKELTIRAVRGSVSICLPVLLLMIIMGGEMLELWMGGPYRFSALIAVVVITYGCDIIYAPLYRILSAVNRHGLPSAVSFAMSLSSILMSYVSLKWWDATLLQVALWGGAPVVLWNVAFLPLLACKRLGIPLADFLFDVWGKTILCMLPFSLCLGWAHSAHSNPGKALMVGLLSGGFVLGLCYWFAFAPAKWKRRRWRRSETGLSTIEAVVREPL